MSSIETEGRTAVITGAASGIGRALAFRAARAGMDLVLADIDEPGGVALADELRSHGTRVLAQRLDAGCAEDNIRLAEDAFAWATSAIVLVFANAGIHGLTDGFDPDLATWERAVRVNLLGPVYMSKAFVARLDAQGVPAQFVVTGSQASFVAAPGMAPYIATKHAAWGFADSLRQDLVKRASTVGVSLVAPSRTESGLTRSQIERARTQGGDAAAQAYIAQLVTPEKVAEVIFREACKRPFWIVPSHEDVLPMLNQRVDELAAAMPSGRIAT